VIANVGVASMLVAQYDSLLYLVPAALGALLTVVWNYVVTLAFVWGQDRATARRTARLRPKSSEATQRMEASRGAGPASIAPAHERRG
jgi:hypothetical protein